MEKAIQLLVNEHKKILAAAEKIAEECEKIKKGKNVDDEFFRKVIEFVRNYADKFHHAKEEDILFKELCSNEGKLHCNPVEQMLYEHNIGRDFIKGLEEGMKKRNRKMVVDNAIGYVHLIREHIFKEDNILYPMAEQVLSKQLQAEMLKKFEKIEKSNPQLERYKNILQ